MSIGVPGPLISARGKDNLRQRLPLLRCPRCTGGLSVGGESLLCKGCQGAYPFAETMGCPVLSLIPGELSRQKGKIQSFWGDLYTQLYAGNDAAMSKDALMLQLEELEDLFRWRRHLLVAELKPASLLGKQVLEIGSGAGGHSALIRKYGAHVTSADITRDRVASTAAKLGLLGDVPGGSELAVQADAERLPFADASFDLVYSNGVLHHSENTQLCVREAHRVLKPGGRLVMMLYSRHSAFYWMNLLPLGALKGLVFQKPEAEWIGLLTEGKAKNQSEYNPITRIYSAAQLRSLLTDFHDVRLRKNSFMISHLFPKSEKLRDILLRCLGKKPHPGGIIVYGSPMFPETRLELWLGKYVGFAWNIEAWK